MRVDDCEEELLREQNQLCPLLELCFRYTVELVLVMTLRVASAIRDVHVRHFHRITVTAISKTSFL